MLHEIISTASAADFQYFIVAVMAGYSDMRNASRRGLNSSFVYQEGLLGLGFGLASACMCGGAYGVIHQLQRLELNSKSEYEEQAEYKFEKLDKDKSGYLEKDEVEALLKLMATKHFEDAERRGLQGNRKTVEDFTEDVTSFLTDVDTNNDGKVSKDEFSRFLKIQKESCDIVMMNLGSYKKYSFYGFVSAVVTTAVFAFRYRQLHNGKK